MSGSEKPPTMKLLELKGVLRKEGREVRREEKKGGRDGCGGGLNRGGGGVKSRMWKGTRVGGTENLYDLEGAGGEYGGSEVEGKRGGRLEGRW